MSEESPNKDLNQVAEELNAIKRLLILGLLKSGATQDDVAAALGVTQGTVSKMFPKGLGGTRRPKPK